MNLDKEVFDLSIDDIMPNRFQPREMFDDNALQELSNSIKEHGVIQPIIVRKVGDKYEIIAGERRYRASKMAGKDTIPAIVKDLDDKEAAKVALLENLQRKDLTPIEEARTYQTILKLDNMTQEELAANLGKSQSTIANKLRLLQLDDEVQTALLNEKISERHARSLLNISDKTMQRKLLNDVIINRMTVKQLDDSIAKITGKTIQSDKTQDFSSASDELKPIVLNQTTNQSNSISSSNQNNQINSIANDLTKLNTQTNNINDNSQINYATQNVPSNMNINSNMQPNISNEKETSTLTQLAPTNNNNLNNIKSTTEPIITNINHSLNEATNLVSQNEKIDQQNNIKTTTELPSANINHGLNEATNLVQPKEPTVSTNNITSGSENINVFAKLRNESNDEDSTPDTVNAKTSIINDNTKRKEILNGDLINNNNAIESTIEKTNLEIQKNSIPTINTINQLTNDDKSIEAPIINNLSISSVNDQASTEQKGIMPNSSFNEQSISLLNKTSNSVSDLATSQQLNSNITDSSIMQSSSPLPDLSNILNNNNINKTNSQTQVTESSNYNNIYDMRFAINNVRQAVQNTEKFGFKISTEEQDLPDSYQFIIKIDKNK